MVTIANNGDSNSDDNESLHVEYGHISWGLAMETYDYAPAHLATSEVPSGLFSDASSAGFSAGSDASPSIDVSFFDRALASIAVKLRSISSSSAGVVDLV